MENWIKEILQIETRIIPFDRIDEIAFHLLKKYDISYLELDGRMNLLLVSRNENFSIKSILQEINQCNAIIAIPVIYSYTKISLYQRKLLLRNHVPFIVKGNAIYLPFLGMFLSEKTTSNAKRAKQILSPIAQLLFLYLFYSSFSVVSFKQLAYEMKINKMSVSRAINELTTLKIVEVESVGRAKMILIQSSRKMLLESALSFLQNPVLKVVYATSVPLNESFNLAGTKALSEYSMLNENKNIIALSTPIYRSLKKEYEFMTEDSGENDIFEIEVWKYDPTLLARDGKVDLISMYLSLKDTKDERVRYELDKLWENKLW